MGLFSKTDKDTGEVAKEAVKQTSDNAKEALGFNKEEKGDIKELAKEAKKVGEAFGTQAKEAKGYDAPANNAKTPEKELAI
ncbi:MAG: hypothetical protein PQ612_03445 [Rickettsiales bacterium]|nr:hypothetical protein [Pseudomonadota bacterium]MDA0965833.1 hypothetical protein [Pseudomonadota bacterium]MDG4542697.1 hypothetical protein [Rickettsiales bacterium]MDG4545201.1 hypothetical protein [Rickettsiales bacterium]MDG4547324.1 hypothetical protein [Rickettsiales bacterium]